MNESIDTSAAGNVISLRSADKMPRSIIFEGGFRILGTPLAFKGCRNPGLLFVSEIDMKIPAGTKRIIGTEVAVGGPGRRLKRLDAIGVSYDRLFKLGKMDLRLQPSGMGPGASMLEIKYNNKKIVYCSGLRTAVPLSGYSVSSNKCDILLFDFEITSQKNPAPRTLKSQLLAWHNVHSENMTAVYACDSATAAFDVVDSFADAAQMLYAQSTVYNLLRSAAISTHKKLTVKKLGKNWPASGAVLTNSRAFPLPRFPEASIASACFCGNENLAPRGLPVFPMGMPEHLAGLIQFARKCGAHTVAISPAGGESAAAAFKKAGFDVVYSRVPHQLKLPL